jgi:hypothetical protein
MPDIVTVDELKAYLGDAPASPGDDDLLESLLDDAEALFESATLRPQGFYTAADTDRTEVLDGTGTRSLFLTYPIAALTSVKLGYDSTSPDETLDLTNKRVVVYGVGSRVITRTDCGRFGWVGQPRYVEVVYDHQGNLPADAKLPIMEVVASIYRNRGSEGMRSETVGSFYSYTRDDVQAVAATNENWKLAVAANTPVVIA